MTKQGGDTLDGVATARYDIELTDASIAALSALTPNVLAWFELRYFDAVRTLSVWIADEHFQAVEITDTTEITRTRFFNFGSSITITARPGLTPIPPTTDRQRGCPGVAACPSVTH